MSLGTSQSLSSSCATDVDTSLSVFDKQFDIEGGSVFSVAGTTPPQEYKLSVSHDVEKDGTKRHLVRVDYVDDDALGAIATGSAYMVIRQPINATFSAAVMASLVNMVVDFLIEGGANANVTKLLNGEV